MINYSETENRCRSKMLLEYLGEENAGECGTCDVCIRKKKSGLSEEQFLAVTNSVQSILLDNPQPLSKLLGTIPNIKDEQAMQVVQWMLDNEKIHYREGDVLEILRK
jgi:ATP-dependent DNA helicase RecQ